MEAIASPLKEYRCTCGKLLFKGSLFLSIVEIKCKRCSAVITLREAQAASHPLYFMLAVDASGKVTDACYGAESVLGFSQSGLIGRSIAEMCPLLRDGAIQDGMRSSFEGGSPYEIKKNTFLVRDGRNISTESLYVGENACSSPCGYRVFSRVVRS